MTHAKTLIVGASGQVGTQMLEAFGAGAVATSREERDGWVQLDLSALTEPGQAGAVLDAFELDAIYCVGGMTHVDGCEAEPDLASCTNARGPGVLAEYARTRGLPFVFFSTEYVFDGAADDPGPYDEEARTHPLSVYGRSKLEGEQRVLAADPTALVLRTTVVYGPDRRSGGPGAGAGVWRLPRGRAGAAGAVGVCGTDCAATGFGFESAGRRFDCGTSTGGSEAPECGPFHAEATAPISGHTYADAGGEP